MSKKTQVANVVGCSRESVIPAAGENLYEVHGVLYRWNGDKQVVPVDEGYNLIRHAALTNIFQEWDAERLKVELANALQYLPVSMVYDLAGVDLSGRDRFIVITTVSDCEVEDSPSEQCVFVVPSVNIKTAEETVQEYVWNRLDLATEEVSAIKLARRSNCHGKKK